MDVFLFARKQKRSLKSLVIFLFLVVEGGRTVLKQGGVETWFQRWLLHSLTGEGAEIIMNHFLIRQDFIACLFSSSPLAL